MNSYAPHDRRKKGNMEIGIFPPEKKNKKKLQIRHILSARKSLEGIRPTTFVRMCRVTAPWSCHLQMLYAYEIYDFNFDPVQSIFQFVRHGNICCRIHTGHVHSSYVRVGLRWNSLQNTEKEWARRKKRSKTHITENSGCGCPGRLPVVSLAQVGEERRLMMRIFQPQSKSKSQTIAGKSYVARKNLIYIRAT